VPDYIHAYFLAALATVGWGVIVIPIKLARAPGRLGVLISMGVGTTAMILLSGREMAGVFALPPIEWGRYALTGTLQFAAGCMLYYEAVQVGTVSVVVPITRVKAFIMLWLAILWGMETFSWPLLGACLLVVIGGVFVSIQTSRHGAVTPAQHRLSLWLAVGACLCWSFGETLIATLPKQIGSVATNGLLLASGFVVYALFVLCSGMWRELRTLTRRDLLCYGAHGVVSFSFAYVVFVAAVRIAGPPRVTCVTSTYPLISSLIGCVVFRERLMWNIIVGAVLLVGGVILLQYA
jgi:drug/metabolite transporter (DMT)-like permease